MHCAKVFTLTMIVVAGVMVFVSASTALAQEHEVTLCKKLVTLCAAGDLWPAGTEVFLLAKDAKVDFKGSPIIICEDSLITAESSTQVEHPFPFKNQIAQHGVLPTPKLGAGCLSICGNKEEGIHHTLDRTEIVVNAADEFFLRVSGLMLLLKCLTFGTCVYRGNEILVPISNIGEHAAHPDSTNLPLLSFEMTLTRVLTHGGSPICPSTAVWLANYVLYAVEAENGEKGLAWPSLDIRFFE